MKRETHLADIVQLASATQILDGCACMLGPQVRHLPDRETIMSAKLVSFLLRPVRAGPARRQSGWGPTPAPRRAG